ncbi:DEAD/DEAH box helicase family protein [Acrocarpospora catenulata]|uniref:DEAD/DEAH box helicase family protein n=1 Tax=Acrocarpospora catenulata TaxID=2836182 RepID=UPI001BDA81B8|nr:DEAD/DEAH box helicase family protein [Acrocarpospora catenulata]
MLSVPPTDTFAEFLRNLKFARQMVDSAQCMVGLKVGSFDVDDLYRAAWVQAVSAMDHWAHEEIYDRAVYFVQVHEAAMPSRFRDFEIPMTVHDALSLGADPAEKIFREHLKNKLGWQSFQNPDKIKSALALISDVKLWETVARILTSENSNGARVTSQDVTDELTKIVRRRNRISHEADRDPENPGDKTPISAEQVERVIERVEQLVRAMLLAIGDIDRSVLPQGGRRSTFVKIEQQDRAHRFESLLSQHQAEAHSVLLLLRDWTRLGGWITYGSHEETSCVPIFSSADTDHWAIAIYPVTGKVFVTFDRLAQRPPFDDRDLRTALLDRLNRIPGVALPEDGLECRAGFPRCVDRERPACGTRSSGSSNRFPVNVGTKGSSRMSDVILDDPILNSPYDEPTRHFRFGKDGITNEIIERRRPSSYFMPVPRSRKNGQQMEIPELSADRIEPNTQVNEIRTRVEVWRRRGYPNVTATTRKLLEYWADPGRDNPILFCQREAAETAIYIAEAAVKDGQTWIRNYLNDQNLEHNDGLPRVALKMATGSGKTVVMAMLIAWQTLNYAAGEKRGQYARRFLVVTPGITIRDRLRVLLPESAENYYKQRDLVPAGLWNALRQARIVITNFHAFHPRETRQGQGASKITKEVAAGGAGRPSPFQESWSQVVSRVCRELGGTSGIVVLNDEAHHCYRT